MPNIRLVTFSTSSTCPRYLSSWTSWANAARASSSLAPTSSLATDSSVISILRFSESSIRFLIFPASSLFLVRTVVRTVAAALSAVFAPCCGLEWDKDKSHGGEEEEEEEDEEGEGEEKEEDREDGGRQPPLEDLGGKRGWCTWCRLLVSTLVKDGLTSLSKSRGLRGQPPSSGGSGAGGFEGDLESELQRFCLFFFSSQSIPSGRWRSRRK